MSKVSPSKAVEKYKKPGSTDESAADANAARNDRLIDPNSPFMRKWDLTSLALLQFVMVVTPYEVAFMDTKVDAMFVINRLIDLYFISDMVRAPFSPLPLSLSTHPCSASSRS
jgi:hypothetical protein